MKHSNGIVFPEFSDLEPLIVEDDDGPLVLLTPDQSASILESLGELISSWPHVELGIRAEPRDKAICLYVMAEGALIQDAEPGQRFELACVTAFSPIPFPRWEKLNQDLRCYANGAVKLFNSLIELNPGLGHDRKQQMPYVGHPDQIGHPGSDSPFPI